MAGVGVRGRPVEPLALTAQERTYSERQVYFDLAPKFADKVAILSDGTLHDLVTAAAVLTPENLAATFGIKARAGSCLQSKAQLIVDSAI